MSDLEDRLRFTAANDEAKRLGYRIEIERELNHVTHTAWAYRLTDEPPGRRFLCRGNSPSLDTLEDGVEILRGVVERRNPWPDSR